MIDSIYEGLGRFREDDTSGDLLKYLTAVGAPLDRIYGIVGESEEGDPGWSAVFDMDRAPTSVLPWTAQFVGSKVTPAMNRAQAVGAITNPDGFGVGKASAIRSAAERTLTGTRRIVLYENAPEFGFLYVRTIATETPDPAETERAIRSQKPWYAVLDYAAATGLTYLDVDTGYDTYSDLEAAGLTYEELAEQLP